MRHPALHALLGLLVLVASCSHPRPAASNSQGADIPVASVPGEANALTNMMSALTKAGIPFFASGSSMYIVRVPAGEKLQAAEILKKDAQIHKYDVTFY